MFLSFTIYDTRFTST